MIKNIVSDFGNVLAEFNPYELVKNYSVNLDRVETIATTIFISDNWLKWDRDLITKEKISKDAKRILKPEESKVVDEILNTWWEYMKFNEKILNFYKHEKETGKKIFILSNYSPDYLELKWDNQFRKIFDGEVISYKYKVGKPDHEIYKILLEKYNLKAEECIFIDDLERNLNAARRLGFKTIRYHIKEKSIEQLIKEYREIVDKKI